jgi:hypothetical protein
MGKITGFLEYEREKVRQADGRRALKHWREFERARPRSS